MNIGIIAASSEFQASVVSDSITSFFNFGNFNYSLLTLKRGELHHDLSQYDAIIIHYSCVAFPYHYELPISSLSTLKIHEYPGLKIALVQDEHRACFDRLQFLTVLNINHLFSVAPKELYEVLYPSNLRNFSISTLLTGYISKSHKDTAKKRIPLIERSTDLAYRGRRLPEWMGPTATIKGEIPALVNSALSYKIHDYIIDLNSDEQSRIYGEKWFNFLQKTRVSIGSPSGSDFLDLYGRYLEPWAQHSQMPPTEIALVRANYQVISPRYFDYVACGNLVALTPGNYSEIPEKNLFVSLMPTMENIEEIIEFSKTREAQEMVDKSQHKILNNYSLSYEAYVEQVENMIDTLSPKSKNTQGLKKITERNKKKKTNYFREMSLFFYFRIKQHLKGNKYLLTLLLNLKKFLNEVNPSLKKGDIKFLFKLSWFKSYYFFNLSLIKEIIFIKNLIVNVSSAPEINLLNPNVLRIYFPSNKYMISYSRLNDIDMHKKYWFIDLSDFGCITSKHFIKYLPKIIGFSHAEVIQFFEEIKKNADNKLGEMR